MRMVVEGTTQQQRSRGLAFQHDLRSRSNPPKANLLRKFTLDRRTSTEPVGPLTVSTTAGEPQRDRAREDTWQLALGEDYETLMRRGREARKARAADAGQTVLRSMFSLVSSARCEKSGDNIPAEIIIEERRWSLRGEPRTRATFADPHPRDFPGGMPIPREYPSR